MVRATFQKLPISCAPTDTALSRWQVGPTGFLILPDDRAQSWINGSDIHAILVLAKPGQQIGKKGFSGQNHPHKLDSIETLSQYVQGGYVRWYLRFYRFRWNAL